jgi:hypothetical protein
MKPDGIKRSVRSLQHDRSAGDAPSIGKVSRMPGTGLPKGVRRRREIGEGGRNNRVRQGRRVVVIIWTLLLSGVAVAVLCLAIWLGLSRKDSEITDAADPVYTELAAASEPPRHSRVAAPEEAEAVALVKQALAAGEPEEIEEWFRVGDTSAQEIVEFLKSLETKEGQIKGYSFLGERFLNGTQVSGVVVNFKAAPNPRNRVAFLVADGTGKWRVDFDAFARTVTPSWDVITGEGTDLARVRVYVAKDNYFNGPFADEGQWVCYGIASPDTSELFLGYCRRGSPQAAAMESVSGKNPGLIRMTLELRRVEPSNHRQFEISRVIAHDWVVGDKALDLKFEP